jgi:hypothetical protein
MDTSEIARLIASCCGRRCSVAHEVLGL